MDATNQSVDQRAFKNVIPIAIWTPPGSRAGPGQVRPRALWDSNPVLSWIAIAVNVAVGIGWIVAHARFSGEWMTCSGRSCWMRSPSRSGWDSSAGSRSRSRTAAASSTSTPTSHSSRSSWPSSTSSRRSSGPCDTGEEPAQGAPRRSRLDSAGPGRSRERVPADDQCDREGEVRPEPPGRIPHRQALRHEDRGCFLDD